MVSTIRDSHFRKLSIFLVNTPPSGDPRKPKLLRQTKLKIATRLMLTLRSLPLLPLSSPCFDCFLLLQMSASLPSNAYPTQGVILPPDLPLVFFSSQVLLLSPFHRFVLFLQR